MPEIEEKIQEYGQQLDLNDLREFLSNLDTEQLLTLTDSGKLNNPSFISTWKYILQGLSSENAEVQEKRFVVVKKVLDELETERIRSTRQASALVNHLCMELINFKSPHLIELCNFCVRCIQSNKVSQNVSWKELFPEVLNVLVERECVEHNGSQMTGMEYKNQLINSLCMIQWSPNIVTSLTSMFIDVPLTRTEHAQVINKLGGFIEQMTPQEIPAFTYQLLKLAERTSCQNRGAIFFRLQQYFGTRIYGQVKKFQSETDSEITNHPDEIESCDYQEISEAESTVLFHVHSCASLGHENVKDHLNSLKNLMRSPEFILDPFQLTVLLTVSTIAHYEEKVFEIVRSCISRIYHEEQKKHDSAWFRSIVTGACNLDAVFMQIINSSTQDRDLVVQGLVNFAFVLLNVGSALGRDPVAEKQWQLGNLILYKTIQRKRHVAPIIIETLSGSIMTGHSVGQHIECMYLLSRNLPLLMIENKSVIITLMEGLVQMPGDTASQLLDALMPLTKVSPTIRDHFILFLRKALYSSTSETRQMAVNGFLKLLAQLKLSGTSTSSAVLLSQSSFGNVAGSFSSGRSIFTQISVNRVSQSSASPFSNEALCLEILSILRRCFVQQAEVKIKLYEGLYDAVQLNAELGMPVLDLIWSHFSEFYHKDEEQLPPLKFNKIATTRDVNVTLQEPLGKLVFTAGLILTKIAQNTDKENVSAVTCQKFAKIFDSLCERMAKCELVHFELDDGTDLLDIVPESQQKLLILKEAVLVYEALIGYKIFSWQLDSENQARDINALFQGYNRLVHFAKNLSKPKTDSKKKKSNNVNNATTTQNQTENTLATAMTTKKDGANNNNNNTGAYQKVTAKSFKMPDTILDFQVLTKFLDLLHEPTVPWTSAAQAASIKSKKEFHQYLMHSLCHVINTSSRKNRRTCESRTSKHIYQFLTQCAAVLYRRIVKRVEEFLDFDVSSGVMAVECFSLILTTVCGQFKTNLKSFLCKVGDKEKEEDLVVLLTEFVETFQKIFEFEEENAENSEDAEMRKMSLHVLNVLSTLVNQIPVASNVLANQMIEWMNKIVSDSTLKKNKTLVTSFVNLAFDTYVRFKVSLTFFEQISVSLGDVIGVISEEDHSTPNEYKIVTEMTAPNILLALCHNLKSILEDVDSIIARLKSEYNMISYYGEEKAGKKRDQLKTKERDVCCHLCFVVSILTNVSNCAVPPGSLSEAILKNLTLLYATLTGLTKHFILRSTKANPVFQSARFERLVKLSGKQLAPIVYKLIMYIEESQKDDVPASQSQNTQKKSKNPKKITKTSTSTDSSSALKTKVLKETRLIPKVVYEIEQFSKFVIQLSTKTKIDLSKFVGQGTVRDFRIMHLNEVLENAKKSDSAVAMSAPSTQQRDSDTSVNNSSVTTDDEDASQGSSPPAKKPRKK